MRYGSPVLPGRLTDIIWLLFLSMWVIPILVGMLANIVISILGFGAAGGQAGLITAIAAMLAQEMSLAGLTVGVVVKDGFSLAQLGFSLRRWVPDVIIGFTAGIGLTIANVFGQIVSVGILEQVLGSDTVMQLLERENDNMLYQFLAKGQPSWLITSTVLLVTVLAPIVEEIFFRGYSYAVIKHWIGYRKALVVSSLLFAVVHLYTVNLLPIFLLGLGLTYLYERSGSLVAPIVAHGVANAMVVLYVLILQ